MTDRLLSCTSKGCRKTYKTERGLRTHVEQKHPEPKAPPSESAADAVERSLTRVSDTAGRAWLVATVRRLAEALDAAAPTDRPKISKELAARMAELMAQANPGTDETDWTDQ